MNNQMLIAVQKHRACWVVLEHGMNAQNVSTRRNGPRP